MERPIIFKGEMVRAILDGRKTMTRRLNKQWLKVKKGDRLWVRETWCAENREIIHYRADGWEYEDDAGAGWKPSIFMPRWASRINLEATADARLERLQEISEEDAIKESFMGQEPYYVDVYQTTDSYPIAQFACYWDSLNPKSPWKDNPAVVVIEFKKCDHKS